MQRAAAIAIDEVGFRLVHLSLGLHKRRHAPDPAALARLRHVGSPLELPPLDAPPPPDVTIEEHHNPGGLRPDLRVRFPSPRPCDRAENNTVHIDLYRPGGDWGSGIVLGCPGVLTGARKGIELPFRWYARHVSERGLTFGLVHPPYHMNRTPAGLMSGELMLCGDVFTVGAGFEQSVYDLKAAVSWALTIAPRVGYWGCSLGGIMGLLLVTREPRLSCCVPMIPAAEINAPFFKSTLCQIMREDFAGAGGTAADLHALMEPLDAFNSRPAIARDRLLLVEAMYDCVCYAADLERLWQAWDCPPIARYPEGHLSIVGAPACIRDMTNYLQTYLSGPPVIAAAPPRQLAAAA